MRGVPSELAGLPLGHEFPAIGAALTPRRLLAIKMLPKPDAMAVQAAVVAYFDQDEIARIVVCVIAIHVMDLEAVPEPLLEPLLGSLRVRGKPRPMVLQ